MRRFPGPRGIVVENWPRAHYVWMAMGRNPFEDVDPDLKAMRSSASTLRWGRVLVGVGVVACLTFAFAYYLPLARAHEMLSKQFAEVSSQVASANREATEARAHAQELSDKNQKLEGQLAGINRREETRAEASRVLKSSLEAKLDKPLAKGQASVGVAAAQALAALSFDYLLVRGKLEISPQGKAALCGVANASSQASIRVLGVADKKDLTPILAKQYRTPLGYGAAVASLVGDTLLEKCSINPARVTAAGAPSPSAAKPKVEGKQLAGSRVELWLDSAP